MRFWIGVFCICWVGYFFCLIMLMAGDLKTKEEEEARARAVMYVPIFLAFLTATGAWALR